MFLLSHAGGSLLHLASLVSLLHLSPRLLLSCAVGCEGAHHHGLPVVETQADSNSEIPGTTRF